MEIEGRLDITLTRQSGAVTQATVRSSRPLHASRILEGGTLDEALQRLPLVFSVCATAQSEAALSAFEQALSVPAPEVHKQARGMLVWMESAREHLLRLLLDWPGFLDEPVDRDRLPPVMRLLPDMTQALYGKVAPFRLDSRPVIDMEAAACSIDELEGVLEAVIGNDGDSPFVSIDAFDEWLVKGDTMPARLLHRLRERGWSRLGRSDVDLLPVLDEAGLQQCFMAVDAADFLAAPTWHGAPCETTPLQRQCQEQLIAALLTAEGNGLLTRMTALLVELKMIPALLRQQLTELEAGSVETKTEAIVSSNGIGLAQVEAARGRLIHRVEIEDGKVRRFQILAPTEWNFHPAGIAAKGLRTLTGADEDELRQQASLLINAIDPCVGFNLRVSGNA